MKNGYETYNAQLCKSNNAVTHPIFIGTATIGMVRIEWALARFGQVIPCNWAYRAGFPRIPDSAPLNYAVADAQNIICKNFLEQDCQWLFLLEHDNLLPPDCFVRLNEYMRSKKVPIVSGLYFTKSMPSEPLVYRGRGNSYYSNWKIGDEVWCDGVPTGSLLIHRSIIEVMWKESEEYTVCNQTVRRVFHTPMSVWHDPEQGWRNASGTSDLEWCARVIVDNIFEKAGWPQYQEKRYPFLVDTNIFVGHIDNDGNIFPPMSEKAKWERDK